MIDTLCVETAEPTSRVIGGANSERIAITEQFRTALEAAPVGMLMMDSAGTIVLVNAQIEVMFGYARDELLGERIEKLVPARFRAHHPTLRREFFREPKTRSMGVGKELYGLRKDGSELPIEIGLNPLRTDSGEFVLSSISDITERQRAGEFRQQMTALIESAEDAIMMKGLDGIIRSWNPAAEHLLGYCAEEMIGQSVTRLIPQDRQEEESRILEQIRKGLPVAHFETQRRRKDGSLVAVSLTVSPVRDHVGTIIGASKIMRDITERQRAAERDEERSAQLAAVNAALALKNEEVEAFVYIVSHDLRAPLVNLQGFSRELERNCVELQEIIRDLKLTSDVERSLRLILTEDIPGALRFISASTTKFERLIDALLQLSRTGKQDLRMDNVDVNDLVQTTLSSLQQTIQNTDSEVTVDALPSAYADRAKIDQVFSNLLANSLQYLRPGRPGRITVGGERKDRLVHYWIRDNGLGIPASSLDRLFQVFQRFHPEVSPGEGMGLAIVKRIIDRHGGRIWADSTENVGTTMHFTFKCGISAARE